jgi:xanthine dehydrogenase accessory factor
MTLPSPLILVRGGGDLASGAVARLHRAGFSVVVLELARPLAVRRLVSFAEAVYAGEICVEEMHGVCVGGAEEAARALEAGAVPVWVDPEAECRQHLRPVAIVDGRMRKRPPEPGVASSLPVIGLGPGFTAGLDCLAVVETKRGAHLGRVIWQATPPDTACRATGGLRKNVLRFRRQVRCWASPGLQRQEDNFRKWRVWREGEVAGAGG